MGRIVDRQTFRADISTKEMIAEYHEHHEWYDEDFDAFIGEDGGDAYPFPYLDSSDEIDRMIAGNFDDYPDYDEFDGIILIEYEHGAILETVYIP